MSHSKSSERNRDRGHGQDDDRHDDDHGQAGHEGGQWTENDGVITRTEVGRFKVETTVYADTNDDGWLEQVFELEVRSAERPGASEQYRFTLADGSLANGAQLTDADAISGMQELARRGWKAERLDLRDSLQAVTVGDEVLIVHTERERSGALEFTVFRDGDADGLWTEIAEGETAGLYLLNGQVDLVGLAQAGLLAPADPVVG